MEQEEINQKFRQVREQVASMATKQEGEIRSKVETLKSDTAKKLSPLLS